MEYLRLYLKKVFWKLPGKVDYLSGLGTTIVTVLIHFFPYREEDMTELFWQIPMSIFVITFSIRVIAAPYLIWKDQKEKEKNLRIELDKQIRENKRDELLQKQTDALEQQTSIMKKKENRERADRAFSRIFGPDAIK